MAALLLRVNTSIDFLRLSTALVKLGLTYITGWFSVIIALAIDVALAWEVVCLDSIINGIKLLEKVSVAAVSTAGSSSCGLTS